MMFGFFTSRPSTSKSSSPASDNLKQGWVKVFKLEKNHKIITFEPPSQPITNGNQEFTIESDLDFEPEMDIEAENGAPFRQPANRAAREAKRSELVQRRLSYERRSSSRSLLLKKKKSEKIEEGGSRGWGLGSGREFRREFGRMLFGILSEFAFVVMGEKRTRL
ncbi:hypothetical protein BJ508DRAFT_306764 [Ascobolus immersus RN42]|uniref:Uncharacterized protein n=1 Tax=Ascobolus immersus RN42 TaxID=1160509 RepID=A0A3N4IAU4_ASCIM|nr:hypothetical protein BJ508DRAFT_306764 [Ascobolus immersus RN42]